MIIEEEIANLNPQQKEAVLHLGSPLLILAGPGSGKTRVITLKISWLIKELQINPNNILAMTFTNKAAKEMKERVKSFTQDIEQDKKKTGYSFPHISTFHSCGAYLLRKFYEEAGLEKNFQIYDSSEQLVLLKEANPKVPKKKLAGILHRISKAKDYGLTSDDSEEKLNEFILDDISCFKNYEALKTKTGNLDFGDLLIKPYTLIEENKDVKAHIKHLWQWFFVDEYQDTNKIQSKWLYSLCSQTANVTVVGDDDQSIYRFRGAIIENILRFQEVFTNTKKIMLGQNYRSTPQIVSLANEVISKNRGRYGKTIFSKQAQGVVPRVMCFYDEGVEENFVVEQAREAQKEQSSMAVFYRINSQSRGYEMALQKAQILYEVVGSVGFFERMEVKDAIALMRLFKNENDIVSFLRIANKPARGIGESTLKNVSNKMKLGKTWRQAKQELQEEISKKASQGFDTLESIFNTTDLNFLEIPSQGKQKNKKTLGQVLKTLLDKTMLYKYYEEEDEKNCTDRTTNLEEIISYAMDFLNTEEGWKVFFEQIGLNEGIVSTLPANAKGSQNPIQLITLHRSKGLEFDRVIICGLENNLIPMVDDLEYFTDMVEEERRLFYVGITRARLQLSITCCRKRRKYGMWEETEPSLFLKDFNRELVEWTSVGDIVSTVDWAVGERVTHKSYGMGYIRKVHQKEKLTVVHVEFDNEYEASFIPKYSKELTKNLEE